MNLPDLIKRIPKRGIVFLVYIYCVKDVADLKVAVIITTAFLIYTIAQTITDLRGKMQEIKP